MTKNQFIERVISEVTEGGSIPVAPDIKRVEEIIKTAIRKFRDIDDRATELEYIILKQEMFKTPLFRAKRQVKLPDCVKAISFLRTMGSHWATNQIDPDYQKTNYGYAAALMGNPEAMTTAVVNAYYNDFLRHFILKGVTYEFSEHSHMLTVAGRDPASDLCAEAWVYIQEEAMYEIEHFFEYVCAKIKISFANIAGFTDRKLIGNTQINFSEIKNDGKEKISEIEQYWSDQTNTSDFMISDIY